MRSTSPITVRAGVRFLPEDADRIEAALAGSPDVEVEIDFRGVREVHPEALSRLAGILSDRGVRVRFRGLTERHARVMRYLGARASAVALTVNAGDLE
jgi:hypothetical protein